MQNSQPTKFAPAERIEKEPLCEEADAFLKEADFAAMVNAIPDMTLVLNTERQIVYANSILLEYLNLKSLYDIVGARPGEAFRCMHSHDEQGGCGTSEFCRVCGAVNGILESRRKDGVIIKECRMTQKDGNSLDLEVYASSYDFQGKTYTFFTVRDVSDQKRRRYLERIFFHDILNTAGGVLNYTELINHVNDERRDRFIRSLGGLSNQLVEEIKSQQMLLAAENNDLGVFPSQLTADAILNDLRDAYLEYNVAKGKWIVVAEPSEAIPFTADRLLLLRVLGNMLKNACEATAEGETITLGAKLMDSVTLRFWVNNPGYIPRDIQLQLFNRSFSTKGECRGLGTYSIRLLTRRYLGGQEGFSSTKDGGTTFYVDIPLSVIA
ncbi:MAG: PAS domain-containing sensor histidine kinase [Opitutales bacterium]|nr:PAS domain-containing sensor histidine kinase [Opitutales bacterium]